MKISRTCGLPPVKPGEVRAMRTGDTRPGSGDWQWCIGRPNAIYPEDGPCRVLATVNTIGALRAGLDPQQLAEVMAAAVNAALSEGN